MYQSLHTHAYESQVESGKYKGYIAKNPTPKYRLTFASVLTDKTKLKDVVKKVGPGVNARLRAVFSFIVTWCLAYIGVVGMLVLAKRIAS